MHKKIPRIHDNVQFFKKEDNIYYKIKNINNPRPVTDHIWSIIKLVDGVKNIDQIIEKLSIDWEVKHEDIINFFHKANNLGVITLNNKASYKSVSLVNRDIFPTIFNFVVTEQCNLKCVYCFGNYGENNKSDTIKFFPLDLVEPLFKKMSEKGTDAIELTGGEPFLHPGFLEIYKLSLKYFQSISILTNGVLIPDEFYKIFKDNLEKTDIQISIDGGTEQTNAIARNKKNTWDKTLNSIIKLTSLKANLRIMYMLIYDNKEDLLATCKLMKELGIKDFNISIPDSRGRGSSLHLPCGSLTSDIRSPYAQDLIKRSLEARNNYRSIFKELKITKLKDIKVKNCGAGWNSISINSNGEVFACQSLYKSIVLGNVLNEDIASIFYNNPIVDFLANFSKDPLSEKCNGCEYQCAVCLYRIVTSNIDLLRRGKKLCPIAVEYELEKRFNFNQIIEFEIANRNHYDKNWID